MLLQVEATEVFSFISHRDWVNNAQDRYLPYKYTPMVAIAADNTVCHIGEDFRVADEKSLFPIKVYQLLRTAKK